MLTTPANYRLAKFKDADLLYTADLPAGYEIRSGDWRRLLDDQHSLELLIVELIVQNVTSARFGPLSATLLRRLESTLRPAITDLTRAYDLDAVDCEPLPDATPGVRVTVRGALKNGGHHQIDGRIPWSD